MDTLKQTPIEVLKKILLVNYNQAYKKGINFQVFHKELERRLNPKDIQKFDNELEAKLWI